MIRKIVEKDLDAMLKIWNQNYNVLTSNERKHTKKSLGKWYETRGMHEYFGLFLGNKLKGFMVLKYGNKLWIKMLAVKEKGKGHGSKLVQYAVKQAGRKSLITEVKVENVRAINFYYRHNFMIMKYNEKNKEYVLKWTP